ncbi:polyamine-modulated factor 1-like isoform X1 [Eumetopias jubatus]|uniref:polyamine-modulated factor 1-like isoform X1 n=1 Tax=Eumetopias jubatus TaxID=34886 RepID=UPI0010162CEE|nr:polyamine-modulated factor 1-like isoform X1 [Eumetopias jubatus]
MAAARSVNAESGREEKGPEGSCPESGPPGATIPRVKLLDTLVDTFLQKLVAAGSYQRFTDCYKHLYQLQPEMTQRIYDKLVTQLQTSVREEISEIKAEGNLEAVLSSLDKIVQEGKDRTEPAWRPSGIPEEDMRSALVPYFVQQRDALQRRVHRQEAENRQLAEAVLAGRGRVQELRRQGRARQQAWQVSVPGMVPGPRDRLLPLGLVLRGCGVLHVTDPQEL